MALDESIIIAIAAAVANEPENMALRNHLAALLFQAGRALEALEQCAFILAKQPDNLEALDIAAHTAAMLGEAQRADGYRRLYEALAWKQTKGLIDSVGGEMLPDDTPVLEEQSEMPVPDERREPIGMRAGGFESDTEGQWEIERPEITLNDVAGMEEIKRRLNLAFLAPMRNPEMMKLYGKSLRGGLMLYGPPGCGKTFIARAVAGELGARFLSIGLSDVLDMWFGQSEKNLHAIFETARRNRPCVLFFDEIDALGRKRSLLRESVGRDVVNQLLSEMDSVNANNDGVFILAATNHPWDVDTALRRPGRLDRTLLVLPPDAAAREAILRSNLRERPTANLDLTAIAVRAEEFSGADMTHLCESAAEIAMEESLLSGRARPITMNDFRQAIGEIKPSVRLWFETARNYALFANEGGVYDDLVNYLRSRKLL